MAAEDSPLTEPDDKSSPRINPVTQVGVEAGRARRDLIDRDHGGVEAYLRGPAAMSDTSLHELRRLLIE